MAASDALMTVMNSRGCSYHRRGKSSFLSSLDRFSLQEGTSNRTRVHTHIIKVIQNADAKVQVENKATSVCDTMQTRRSHDQSVVHRGDLIGSDEDKATQTGPIAARTNCK